MKRTLFLILCYIFISYLQAQAQGVVEIFAGGHKYSSMQAYLASKKAAALQTEVKTSSSDPALHRMYVLSVENGVVGALQDFYRNWGQSGIALTGSISPGQLQAAIQQAVTKSTGPKLLIAEHGKLRIVAINAEGPKNK